MEVIPFCKYFFQKFLRIFRFFPDFPSKFQFVALLHWHLRVNGFSPGRSLGATNQ